ncbi:hypothetical protein GNP76_18255 [Aliivibrio fischeri]|nr:hypothetical protein [Aliivibrio fischeri]MUK75067.1 hypothetical protein [Aliivibrio fischeri]MUK75313.1 hypothetical protein [Aliivibrio fischeri]
MTMPSNNAELNAILRIFYFIRSHMEIIIAHLGY